jgi:chemotaxis protein methyltransferase CheR
MDDKEFTDIISLISKQTGIIPRESHKSGIKNFIDKRKTEINLNGLDYYNYVCLNKEEMDVLLNHATVNETYFFREESQFQFLKTKIMPELHSKLALNPLRIWSAAASSGEEVYSLYLLATSLGIKTECIATDINTTVLQKGAEGKYKPNSVKAVDGAKFHYLLSPYMNMEKEVTFPKEITSKIDRYQINLSKAESIFPKNVHIVFIRNVFVYFTTEMRKAILQKIVDESLAPGGYLFLSMNEIGTIDSSILPKGIEKCSEGNVFYFHKKG